jgi:adenylate cyclase
VLPLVNLSGDAAQEYFSDGMTEEITTKLSRVRGLLVTARTSAARYKASPRSAREIGAELGVAYLIEGSVRRARERIRVNTALVRTADGVQLWSDDVDATLEDIFEVQGRVAARVVDALGVKLKPNEKTALGDWGTRNAHAYDIFLKARERMMVGLEDPAVAQDAAQLLEGALRIDPDFAPALGALATVHAHVYRDFEGVPALLERAESLAGRALALDPRLPTALHAAGSVRAMRFDYAGAAGLFRRVIEESPSDHDAWDKLCWSLGYAIPPGLDEAEKACQRALALQGTYYPAHYHLLRVHLLRGRIDLAERDLEQLRSLAPDNPLVAAGQFWLRMAQRKPSEALDALRARGKTTNLDLAWRAMAHAQLGDVEDAFGQLDAALSGGYRDVADLRTNRYWAPLRGDSRWALTLAKHGIEP